MFNFKLDKDCCSSCSCCVKRMGDVVADADNNNGSTRLTFVSVSVTMFAFIPVVFVIFDDIGSIKLDGTSSVTF